MHRSGTFLFLVLMLGIAVFVSSCASDPPEVSSVDLPAGDAGSGEKLFLQSVNDAPSCASCHNITSTSNVGPGLEGIGERAGQQVEGQDAEEYLYMSIIRPSNYIVRGFSNVMYPDYEQKLDIEAIADLIAYLRTL